MDTLGISKKEIVNREEEREKDRRREMEMGLRECVIKKSMRGGKWKMGEKEAVDI